MKRLLLLVSLFSAIAIFGYSQSLSLLTPQGVVITNASIIQAGTHDSLELITYLQVKNISTHTINVFCKKVEVAMMDSVETTMCWAGGCYPSFVNVSPNSAPMTAGQIVTDFVGHYGTTTGHGFKSGESRVRWVFYNEADHNDSVYLIVKYTSYPLGVDEKNAHSGLLSAAYPNPANASASFNYSVPVGSPGMIVVRNLVGAEVLTEQAAPGSGTLTVNTAGLSDGIYFCSLVLEGKINQTRKLVVRH